MVFRFLVSRVPHYDGRATLLPPTGLDAELSEAFCPAPRGQTTGHVVNLDSTAGLFRREVLHPRPKFRHFEVFRLGVIDQACDRSVFAEARGLHLLELRKHAERPDFASGTDADLVED